MEPRALRTNTQRRTDNGEQEKKRRKNELRKKKKKKKLNKGQAPLFRQGPLHNDEARHHRQETPPQ